MSATSLSVAMVRIGELAIRLGAAPINRLPGCWEHQIDSLWWVAVNGHAERRTITRGGIAMDVDPFTAYIEYNGWPFGFLNPFVGNIGHGEGANEDTFIAALESAIANAPRPD